MKTLKTSEKLFFLPSILLLIGYFLKLRILPNQLLFTGTSFIFILIILIIFLIRLLKNSSSIGLKLIHFLFFPLNLVVIILPYFNSWFPSHLLHYEDAFKNGIIPFIYLGLIIIVSIYFFIINETKYSFSNFIALTNYRNFVLINSILFFLNSPFERVIPDNFYSPQFKTEYDKSKGTEIYIDEGHNNQHTASGTYSPFANILTKDGYIIRPFTNRFTSKTLEQIKILVICNALNEKNNELEQPVYSAFGEDEIQCINAWVKNGGSLFLIADHAPYSGASKKLAHTFGFEFNDGFAEKKISSKYPSDLFCRSNKTLIKNTITEGRNPAEFVDSIVTFVGQAFKIPDSATAILVFDDNYVLNTPQIIANVDSMKTEPIEGFSQGAVTLYGKGRIAAFGEASMFTGQLPAGLSWIKRGFNSHRAKNNYKLLLNTVHWLDNRGSIRSNKY
jgi:hypothetical protein